jgi:uncharacterized protein YbbC (DUF1343 family)
VSVAAVLTGLDRVARGDHAALGPIAGRRVGLLAHPASVTRSLEHAERVIGRVAQLRVLFGPEHGYTGQAQDMASVGAGAADAVAVHSLYGDSFDDLSPRPEWLDGLDAVVVDLQDVGARYYTFVWSAALMLVACAARGVETIVLDRPNPLGGEVLEGRSQRPGYRSFVGLYDVPVRHAMTVGELCQLVRAREGLDPAALRVVPMEGWTRAMFFDHTGLPWVLPSPNMPTLDTAIVYPGGCLVEGTNLSEGRGTTRPFEIWGGPGVHGGRLAEALSFDGAALRPLSFEPTFQKHARRTCGGVQVHVTDRARFRSYDAYLRMLAEVAAHDESFGFRTETYEYVSDRPAIDLLTGGAEFREAVRGGRVEPELVRWLTEPEPEFTALRAPHLLYG